MSAEELREDMERALKRAAADSVSPEEMREVLEDMEDRVDRLAALEGDG